MNYSQYLPYDVLNGDGVRCTLYVSGCSQGCVGCFNEQTWNPKYGDLYTAEIEQQIINDLSDPKINRQGLSLLGGDPLFKRNRETVLTLCKRIKNECPTKDIWLWTGYTVDEVKDLCPDIINYVDVIVDGPFVQELKDLTLKFRGSSNQRIIETKTVW